MDVLNQQLVGISQGLLPYFLDPEVTDIVINGPHEVFLERGGKMESVPSPFSGVEHIGQLIERLLLPIGKRVDANQPFLDGRMVDGSRFHVLLPPLAVKGPYISIRKKRREAPIEVAAFCPPEIRDWLQEQVLSRRNILIGGGTGSGKTTLLGALLNWVPKTERILVLEEVTEITSSHPHLISLEARTASPEGKGEVSLRTLVRNALRMRPDRLVLGECRGPEALDMLQAMNTGHGGSLGTLHANSPLDSLRRLEVLALMAGNGLPFKAVKEWIGGNIQVVIHVERDGEKRFISDILTVSGVEGENYRVLPRYRFGQKPLYLRQV